MQTIYGYLNVGRKYVSQEKFIKLSLILMSHVNLFLLNTEKEYFSIFYNFSLFIELNVGFTFYCFQASLFDQGNDRRTCVKSKKCSHIVLLVEST